MQPTKDLECTIVDLVDRILDKGVVIAADVIISLAGIPLIGLNLRAALAGMETMLNYGMMEAWDENTRRYYAKEIAKKEADLIGDENVILRVYGSCFTSEGIYSTWSPGFIHLTATRLFLMVKSPIAKVVSETPLEKIKAMKIQKEKYFTEANERLHLLLDTGEIVRLNAENVAVLKAAIEKRMKEMGLAFGEEFVSLPPEVKALPLLEGETIIESERAWYKEAAVGIFDATWRPGWMHVTNKRVCWCHDINKEKIAFEIVIESIVGMSIDLPEKSSAIPSKSKAGGTATDMIMNADVSKYLGGLGAVKKERILTLTYKASQTERVALFSARGEKIGKLATAIKKQQEALVTA